jgi:hypothetical protein
MEALTTLRALDETTLSRLSLPYYAIDTLTTLRSSNLTSLEGLDQTSLEALSSLQSIAVTDHYFADKLTSLTGQSSVPSNEALSVLRALDFTKLETLSVPYYTMNALTSIREMSVTSLDELDWTTREALTSLRGLDFTIHGLDYSTSNALTSLGRV